MMPTKPKPITPQRVRAVLRKAGHEAAKSHATRIPGWRDWQPGYVVEATPGGLIRVAHKESIGRDEEKARRQLESYASALADAGIACRVDGERVVIERDAGTTPGGDD